jgi:hypothetical protein
MFPRAARPVLVLAVAACGSRTDLAGPLDGGTLVVDSGPPPSCAAATGVVTLASRPRGTWFGETFAIDDTNVYFLEHGDVTQGPGRLMRVPKCGGAVVLLTETPNYPCRVVVDSTRAYWTTMSSDGMGGLRSVPLAGGTPTTLQTGSNGTGLVLDAAFVYWIDHGQRVLRVPKSGGAVTTVASGPFPWDTVALGGGDIVWTNQPTMGWSVTALPLAGGSVLTLASASTGGVGTMAGLVVDDTRAYWTAFGPGYGAPGTIASVPLEGGPPTPLYTGNPTSLTADATDLYWTEPGDTRSAIRRVSKSGGTPSTVVSGLDDPSAIAVDDTRVYWLDLSNVMAAPK